MKPTQSPAEGRLHGTSIVLSASIPREEAAARYLRTADAVAIEEGVIAVARAVFSEGGTLVFGAHPSISPLVATVLREYTSPRFAEPLPETQSSRRRSSVENEFGYGPRVVVYKSRAYEDILAKDTMQLMRQPGVETVWVEAVKGERASRASSQKPRAPRSLTEMRTRMVSQHDLAGMICIGGMRGVEEEAKLFAESQPNQKIYVFQTSGGAAELLARRSRKDSRVVALDQGVKERVERFWREQRPEESEKGQSHQERSRRHYLPYAYVAQLVVAQIVEATYRG